MGLKVGRQPREMAALAVLIVIKAFDGRPAIVVRL